jgi:cytochrome-b5 reductase
MSELQRHNTADDLWMAVYGVVYDLTYYASRHPGGSRVVANVAGTVMTTNEFERYHKARDVRKVTQYIVGNLG